MHWVNTRVWPRSYMPESAKPGITAFNCPNCGAAVAKDSVRCPYCRSEIATRICPACYGTVTVGMKHCQSCGASVDPAPDSSTTDLRCPRCDSALSCMRVGRTEIQECLQCGGVWLTNETFQDICNRQEEQEAILNFRSQDEAAPAKGPLKVARAYVPCPVCRKLMNREQFAGCSGVVLDWCRNHGSWFDRRELQQIVTFIKDGGLRKARDREQAKLAEEKERLRARQLQLSVRPGLEAGTCSLLTDLNPREGSFLRFLSDLILR